MSTCDSFIFFYFLLVSRTHYVANRSRPIDAIIFMARTVFFSRAGLQLSACVCVCLWVVSYSVGFRNFIPNRGKNTNRSERRIKNPIFFSRCNFILGSTTQRTADFIDYKKKRLNKISIELAPSARKVFFPATSIDTKVRGFDINIIFCWGLCVNRVWVSELSVCAECAWVPFYAPIMA